MLLDILIPAVVFPALFGVAVFGLVTSGIRRGRIRSTGRLQLARAINESRKAGH